MWGLEETGNLRSREPQHQFVCFIGLDGREDPMLRAFSTSQNLHQSRRSICSFKIYLKIYFTYPNTHTSKVILFKINFFSSKFLLSTASTTDSDYLQQPPLTSCHIVMKENPKKSPRAPPNSAIKEVNGYKRTSTSVKVLSDIAQKATKVSFSKDISWSGLGKTFGFVNANLYSL